MRLNRYAVLYSPASKLVQKMTPRARRVYAWLEGSLLLLLATSIALYVQL